MNAPGTIVVLNGVPRAGKSAIATEIQESFPGVWMNLGVDLSRQSTPPAYQPGIGLRPGAGRPDLEALIPDLYASLYDSIAAHSRHGLNVVADMDHHDGYSRPLGVLADAARRLEGLPAWLVGVRCPPEVVVERRAATWAEVPPEDGSIPDHVALWEASVHHPGLYDLEVDTSRSSPPDCALAIGRRLTSGAQPSAFRGLAGGASGSDSGGVDR